MSEGRELEELRIAEVKRYLQVFLEFIDEVPEDVRTKGADGIERAHAAKTDKEIKDALAWVFDFMIDGGLGVDVFNFVNRRGDIKVLNDIADAGMWRLKEWYAV